MNARRAMRDAMLVTVAAVMGACTPPGGGRAVVGELGVSGPYVKVNGRIAGNGTTIYSGDTVTTGPGSNGLILFPAGGSFQLDQNTDPEFTWGALATVRCLLVKIYRGQAYANDSETCISTPAADAFKHSQVNVIVSEAATVMTLFEGTLTLERPQRVTLLPGQGATVENGSTEAQVRTLSPAELAERAAWRMHFRFQGWCSTPGGLRQSWLGDCPGRFSFAQPQSAAPQFGVSPFLPFGTMGPRYPSPGRGTPGQGQFPTGPNSLR
jgi:hypothetical protein